MFYLLENLDCMFLMMEEDFFNDGRRFSAAPNILIHFLMHGWGASIWGREKNVGIIIHCRCMV